jgi:hypothetical protein
MYESATANNRAEMLESAGAFDIVIASYGLLQSEEKLFYKKEICYYFARRSAGYQK